MTVAENSQDQSYLDEEDVAVPIITAPSVCDLCGLKASQLIAQLVRF